MRKSIYPSHICAQRRAKVAPELSGAALIIAGNPDYIRNNDVSHPYRQDSNMIYLTGFEEANSVFVFRPGCKPETVMFVMPKDEDREIWNGFRFGPELVKTEYGIERAYNIGDLESQLPSLLAEVDKVYYSMFINKEVDQRLLHIIEDMAQQRSRSNAGNLSILDPKAMLGEFRLQKDAFEQDLMRKAASVSCRAHVELMKAIKPGMNERAMHGLFIKSIMEQGCAREGYGSIMAGGVGATCLHYTFNDQELRDGDMFLVDAGGEYQYYSADITRCYPVNGKFNPAQARLYSALLELQKHLVSSVKPSQTREGLQKIAIDGIIDICLNEKLLKGSKAEIMEKRSFMKYYMHGVGHWLGMDVHDAGLIEKNGEPRPLETGFCLTIEPGIYIPANDSDAPEELRGIGLRIEDDILVTATGCENLTEACPKEIADLESLQR